MSMDLHPLNFNLTLLGLVFVDSVRCLFVLDLVILFFVYFFLGREAHRCVNGASIL